MANNWTEQDAQGFVEFVERRGFQVVRVYANMEGYTFAVKTLGHQNGKAVMLGDNTLDEWMREYDRQRG